MLVIDTRTYCLFPCPGITVCLVQFREEDPLKKMLRLLFFQVRVFAARKFFTAHKLM